MNSNKNTFAALNVPSDEEEAPKNKPFARNKPEGKTVKPAREGPKPKGVPAEPHPLDRRSGTGRGKEVSKGGHGTHNWGDFKDDLRRGNDADVGPRQHYQAEHKEEVAPAPKEIKTLSEFYSKVNAKEVTVASNVNTTYELFHGQKKGKAEVDDHKEVAKSNRGQRGEFAPRGNAEYADLLGFQSGLQEVKPRKPRVQREEQEQQQQQPPAEGAQEQQGSPTEKLEGKEGEEVQSPEGGERRQGGERRGGRGQGRREGGERRREEGDRRREEGDRRREEGDRRRDEGERRDRRPDHRGPPAQQKPVFDDKSFPTLS